MRCFVFHMVRLSAYPQKLATCLTQSPRTHQNQSDRMNGRDEDSVRRLSILIFCGSLLFFTSNDLQLSAIPTILANIQKSLQNLADSPIFPKKYANFYKIVVWIATKLCKPCRSRKLLKRSMYRFIRKSRLSTV